MFTSEQLIEGNIYTRVDLRQKFDVHDATINTGVFRVPNYQSIWLFVTEEKTSDRHQFTDLLEGDILNWDGQLKGRTDHLIKNHEASNIELLVFYRKNRFQYAAGGFRYEGRFVYKSHDSFQPTHFVLQRLDPMLTTIEKDIAAFQAEESYQEGELSTKLVSKHERNRTLRYAAVKIHGTTCQVCGFSFTKTYGKHGDGFIEIHHLYPLANYTGAMKVDPRKDMVAVCANCHRMIHRNPERPLSIEELKDIVTFNREQK